MLNKPKLLHVLPSLDAGGTELGILHLQQHGFYKNFDIEILALVQGASPHIYQSYLNAFGDANITVCSHNQSIGYQDLLFLFPRFLHELSRIKPDALILSLPKPVIIGTMAALFHPKLVVVSFEHMGRDYSWKFAALMKWLTHRVDLFFGDCRLTIDIARKIHPATILGYEVPLIEVKSNFTASSETKPECYNILSLGRFTHQKNYVELLHAIHQLKEQNYPIHLTLAGQGEDETLLKKTVQQLGLEKQVTFAGYINAVERDAALAASHIYIQPSLYEGQCLSVIEAMAAGKTVVATDVGGMRTYGQHNVNMIKIEGFTRDGIVKALTVAMETYPNVSMMRAACQTAEREYGHKAVQFKWQNAIDALLNSIKNTR